MQHWLLKTTNLSAGPQKNPLYAGFFCACHRPHSSDAGLLVLSLLKKQFTL